MLQQQPQASAVEQRQANRSKAAAATQTLRSKDFFHQSIEWLASAASFW